MDEQRKLHDGLEIFIIYETTYKSGIGKVLAINVGIPRENEQFSDEWTIEWRKRAGIKEDEMTQANCERWFNVMDSVSSLQLPISKRDFPETLWGLSLEESQKDETP